jgi:hypothetical protein
MPIPAMASIKAKRCLEETMADDDDDDRMLIFPQMISDVCIFSIFVCARSLKRSTRRKDARSIVQSLGWNIFGHCGFSIVAIIDANASYTSRSMGS